MKKFLSMMGALSLVVTSTTTVIACTARELPIDVTIGSEEFADEGVSVAGDSNNKYNFSQLMQATTYTPESVLKNANRYSFAPINILAGGLLSGSASINNDIFNVLNSSNRKIVKANKDQLQLRSERNYLAGREKLTMDYDRKLPENERYLRPAIDGLVMNWENQEKYYQMFDTSTINSFEGLYKLATFKGDAGKLSGLQKEMQTLFDEPDAKAFIEWYMGISKKKASEAHFSKIKFNPNQKVNEMFDYYETQATKFDSKQATTSGDLTTGPNGAYKEVNKDQFGTKDIENEAKARMKDRKITDPYASLVLKSKGDKTPSTSKLEVVDIKKNDPFQFYQLANPDTVYVYNSVDNKDGDEKKYDYKLVGSQFYYQNVQDLHMEYEFNTDYRSNSGTKYTITFDLTNLSAIWAPMINPSPVKDKDKPGDFNKDLVWTFVGYKFSNANPLKGYVADLDKEENKDKKELLEFEQTHRFQDFKMTNLKISKQV